MHSIFPSGDVANGRNHRAFAVRSAFHDMQASESVDALEPPTTNLPPLQPALTNRKSMADWTIDARMAYQAGKFVNHRLSKTLHAAKTDLVPYGEWTEMWVGEDRLFAVRKADKLAFVGEHLTSLLRLDRAEDCLPTALNTLYALAHLGPEILLKLIAKDVIHRKLSRKAAEALVKSYQPDFKPETQPFNLRRTVARIGRQLRLIKSQSPPDESAWALRKVQKFVDRTAAVLNPKQHQRERNIGKGE